MHLAVCYTEAPVHKSQTKRTAKDTKLLSFPIKETSGYWAAFKSTQQSNVRVKKGEICVAVVKAGYMRTPEEK